MADKITSSNCAFRPFTREQIVELIQKLWNAKQIRLSALDFELCIDHILKSELSAEEKNRACMEALDAWTRRGHFDPAVYFTNPEGMAE